MGANGRATALKTPASGPTDLEQFVRDCLAYAKANPWNYTALRSSNQGREFLNALSRIGYATYGRKGEGKAGEVAELLGIPFNQHPVNELNARKKRVFEEFDTIHPVIKGKRTFLSPSMVNSRHHAVYQRTVRLFGSYANAMDAWQPDAYEQSVRLRNRANIDRRKLREQALDEYSALVALHHFVSRGRLRHNFPKINSIVHAAMLRYGAKDYARFVSQCGVTPPKTEEIHAIGFAGELFSFAWLFLGNPDTPLITAPEFPPAGKLCIYAPKNTRSTECKAWPDLAVADEECGFLLTEIKSGFYFPKHNATELVEKYSFNAGNPLRMFNSDDPTRVMFQGVHLHFAPDCIDSRALNVFEQANLEVILSPEISTLFRGSNREIHALYAQFISRPLEFVRRDGIIDRLEELVLNLAPISTRNAIPRKRV